jgi:hypothetical protein
MPSPLIDQVTKLRAAQAAQEAAELQRLVDAYAAIDRAARREAEALALKLMDTYASTGKVPTEAQIMRLSRYREMMDGIQQELEQYQSFMKIELRSQSAMAITEGERAARTLAELAAREMGIKAQFQALEPAQIEQLIGFLDPRGPLYKRLGELGGWTSEQVSQSILQGVGMGLNPKTTAAMLTKTLSDGVTSALGMGLTDALRTMRTCQLWSFREASRASYTANSDVVSGWTWLAELDQDTCATCVSMSGTTHTNDEVLDGHWNCRCVPVPIIFGQNAVEQSGSDWFDQQDETMQRAILGPGKYDAWKDNKFTLADVPIQKENDTYGTMRFEKTLQELIGGE